MAKGYTGVFSKERVNRMVLISLKQAELAFGDHVLLDKVDLDIRNGERLCVVGRNGAGKSTLLKILAGNVSLDDGRVEYSDTLRVSSLQQELPKAVDSTVYNVVADGFGDIGQYISQYHAEIAKGDAVNLNKLEQLQAKIETADGWRLQQRVDAIIQRLNLPADENFASLSGGWQRRVMLAKALVVEPDVLILDEPTNHMDIATIEWLEEQLKQYNGCLVFISHDRAFVQALSTRIVELDRGYAYSWDGDYNSFIEYRDKRLEDEATQNALFDKRLAEEEKWIRKGVQARRTRNQGRVQQLREMRKERRDRRELQGSANISLNATDSSGKQVFELKDVTFAWGEKVQVNNFSTLVMRGDRIGLVGPNGVGKSTLLKLLLGKLEPQSGTIRTGTKLEVAYFDQTRELLDEEKSIAENVGDGKDMVEVNGQSRHIVGYLGDFLFAPERARTPVKALSGGERNRVMLAKLFLKPCNLLVMDEPTNDLDVETLELLEERLLEYNGTLLLVSHDRSFLDNVVTQLWVFSEGGHIDEQIGGYTEWQERKQALAAKQPAPKEEVTAKPAPKVAVEQPKAAPAKKLSYKLQRELDMLPEKIAAAEEARDKLLAITSDADFYSGDAEEVQASLQALTEAEERLNALEERWLELEEMNS